MSSDLKTAQDHLSAVAQGAQILKRHIESRGSSEEARDFLELMRHMHGAIEHLASAVRKLEQRS